MSAKPELNATVSSSDFKIDATPDGKYAVRILKNYLKRAKIKFETDNREDNEVELFNFINSCQDKRAIELENAISILEEVE